MFRILIAEDNAELRHLFSRVLSRNGYEPLEAVDGAQALEILDHETVDLIISDIMMPKVDGFELTALLREAGYTLPILMITAAGSFNDIKKGFSSGTDDYMVKPVNVEEMVIRVGALLRRAQMINDRKQTIGGTVLDYDAMTVTFDATSFTLPQKEFQLLYKLLSDLGHIFTRQQLMDDIWGIDSYTDPHTVEVHIGRLRDKLRDNRDFEIVTMRGVGYKAVKRK
ncbi:response regulator transcription factor [Clostridium sp. BJN0013]|uniref:response regulator transcription factor n=1 Tax=Clostridium sp. BJN0013 TaxID=3236840 RepID=UPI0034C5E5AD